MANRDILLAGAPALLLDLGERLEGMGYVVAGMAATVEEAARLARELAPGVIILGVGSLGVNNPKTACRAIRKSSIAPIVLVVQAMEDLLLNDALASDATATLVNPFWDGQLRALLESAPLSKWESDILRLRQNLDIHKTELEMQNQELREARNNLESLHDKYVRLFDFAPVGYMITNRQGVVVEANLAACAMLGAERSFILGQPVTRFLANGSQSIWRSHLAAVMDNGGQRECELSIRPELADGLDLQALSTDQAEPEGETTCLTVLVDISQRNRNREALVRAKLAAEAASLAKSEFLANMSHELRTPLAGLLGMIDLVCQGGGVSHDAGEYLFLARESGQRLLAIINDILDLSRIEAGRLTLIPTAFTLRTALDDILGLFASSATVKGLVFSVEIAADVPDHLIGDQLRLGQILTNLVGNAIKFTEHGRIQVRVSVAKDQERPDPSRVTLRFDVEDTGIGIPLEQQENVFESFVQADGSLSRGHGGVGLGLAISRQLAALMGGRIWVTSRLGRGSIFSFTSVLHLAEDAEPVENAVPLLQAAAEDSLRILVAEDDPINRLYLRVSLETLGHAVTEAVNGEDALEKLAQDQFDLVFMDVQMPFLDGVAATARIRRDPPAGVDPAIPIVALTAHALTGDEERFLEAGMDRYLSKPVELAKLEEVLAWAMAKREAADSAKRQ